MAGDNVLYWLV